MDFAIYDNFDPNPDQLREYMLSCQYSLVGNFPGFRAKPSPEYTASQKDHLESVIGREVILWDDYFDNPLCFHWSHDGHDSWVHHDTDPENLKALADEGKEVWAGIHYMTPNARIEAGTGLYRLRENHNDRATQQENLDGTAHNLENYDVTAWCGNIYNRFVTYKAEIYHRNICGFGTNKRDGRLTQLFFYGLRKQ